MFVNAVGKASGALERVATDINYFYQLGVEGQPTDSNGKLHRVKIEVTRPNVSVRAPAEIAAMRPVKSGDSDALKNALSQPTDLSEIPFEIASYVTHADEPSQVRVVVVATTPDTADFAPAEWGYIITKDGKEVGGSHEQISPELRRHWTGTSGLVVAPGRYRVRAAVLAVDGRIGTLDLPLTAGLRAAGDVTTSDLMIGSLDEGRLLPRPRLAQSDAGMAMLELSSPAPLTGTTGTLELHPRWNRATRAASGSRTAAADGQRRHRRRARRARPLGRCPGNLHRERGSGAQWPAVRAHQPPRRCSCWHCSCAPGPHRRRGDRPRKPRLAAILSSKLFSSASDATSRVSASRPRSSSRESSTSSGCQRRRRA